LNKYGDKNEVQLAYSDLGNERRAALNKLKELHENLEDKEMSSYDEENVG